MGKAWPDLDTLQLALLTGKSPAEIETWDARDAMRLLAFLQVRKQVRANIAKRHKVPVWMVPEDCL